MTTTTITTPATPAVPPAVPAADARRGFFFALSAYLLWGVLPFYMKAVSHIPSIEVVAHRILWSLPVAGLLLVWLGRTSDIAAAVRNPRTLALGAMTAVLIGANWGIYVWSIAAGRALETALGYYINPLFSIFLGAVVLGERMTRPQLVAIGLAMIAVAILTWEAGGLPWVSLGLATTWAFYALFKKTLPIGPAQGFFLEILLLSPLSLGYLVWLETRGVGHLHSGMFDLGLLAASGLVTAVPLILYANGAKLLRLSTIGLMQYIAPTMIFLVAVFVFREPFSMVKAVAFGFIWAGLVLYSLSMLRGRSANVEG